MKKGDLIRLNSGKFARVIRGDYPYRFMEAEDYEMEAHGMGHLAGLYGTAFDAIIFDTGRVIRLRHVQGYTVVDSASEVEEMALAFADH